MKSENHIDFESIYTLYYSKLKRYVLNYVLDENDAEDIVHDIFTELWEKREGFSSHGNIFAYLYLATKNRCLNFLKRKNLLKGVKEQITTQLKLNQATLEWDDTAVYSTEDVEQAIEHALEKLPERCRRIFVMSRFEGKKHQDIARELNITVNTVETQMGVAYKKLRVELKRFQFLLILFF